MSTFLIEVSQITDVLPHENADSLEIIQVKGWYCIAQKGLYKKGDLVVYVPPDSVLPVELSDFMNVTKYTHNGRVKTVKLRGVISQGLLISIPTLQNYLKQFFDKTIEVKIGDNLSDILKITKYEPPTRVILGGMTRRDNPKFPRYTDIENWKNFPDVLQEGEEVVITEKLHGTNSRFGNIQPNDDLPSFYIGTHNTVLKDEGDNVYVSIARKNNLSSRIPFGFVIYGEIYGAGLQKGFTYDHVKEPGLRIFDIQKDSRYLNYDEFLREAEAMKLDIVPILYRGPYTTSILKQLAQGQTVLGKNHIREGVVVKPTKERWHPKLGRVILKYINETYEEIKHRKNIEDTYGH